MKKEKIKRRSPDEGATTLSSGLGTSGYIFPVGASPLLAGGLLRWPLADAFCGLCSHAVARLVHLAPWHQGRGHVLKVPCPKSTGLCATSSPRPWGQGIPQEEGQARGAACRYLQCLTHIGLLQCHGNAHVCKEQMLFPLLTLSPFVSHVGCIHSDSMYLSKYVVCLLIQTACSLFFFSLRS